MPEVRVKMSDMQAAKADDLLKLASDIVAAYVSNNPIAITDVPGMIKSVHATLGGLSTGQVVDVQTTQKPAVNWHWRTKAMRMSCGTRVGSQTP